MISLLQSSWMVALVGGLLYLGTTFALLKPAHFAGVQAHREPVKYKPGEDPSWKFSNPEFDQLVNELKRERDALAVRTQELQELQSRLATERQELSSITQAVHQLQIEFDRSVIRFKAQEAENSKKQLKVVVGMSPEGAAAMLGEMPDEDVVKLMSLMKPDEAGAILDAMSRSGSPGAKRAAMLTDRMRRVLPATPGAKPPAAS